MTMADEPSKIEVNLAFLSGHDSAAFRDMVSGVKVAAEFMKAFQAADFATAAERLVNASKMMAEETRAMQSDLQKMQTQRTGGLAGALGQGVSNFRRAAEPDERAARTNVREEADANAQKARDDLKEKQDREKAHAETTDLERAAAHRRQQFSVPLPPKEELPPDHFSNRIESLNPEVAGIRIPQFGNLTVQDMMQGLRDRQLKKSQQADDPASQQRFGEQAATLDEWSRRIGQGAALHSFLRLSQRGTQGVQGFVNAFDAPGAALGYDRASNILGLPFAGNVLSGAGKESARQMWDIANLRFKGGINKEQAQAINQATTRAGFSGEAGTDIRRELMAPAVQQMGIDPNALIPFTQTLRTGTSSIQELNGVIANLGTGARSARMNVDEFAQAIAQSGEQAQATGGTFMQGAQFGEQFSASTGLGPNVGNNLLQNNVVKGYLSARTGLPGRSAGAASPLAQQRSIEQALKDRVSAYAGSMPGHSEAIRDVDGKVIGQEKTSARDAEIGAAAADLGISQEEAKAMLNRKGGANVANFQAMSRDYELRASGGRTRGQTTELGKAFADKLNDKDSNIGFVGRNERRFNARTGKIEHKKGLGLGGWYVDEDATDKFEKKNFNVKDQLRNAEGSDLAEMHQAARASGVSQKDWEKQVEKQKDPHKQAAAARKLVENAAGEANDPNAIKFTGAAAKFFKALVDENKGLAGAGDLSKSAVATSNKGSSPLSNQSNAAGGFGGLSATG